MSIGPVLPGYSYGAAPAAGVPGAAGTAGNAGAAGTAGNAGAANPLAALAGGAGGQQGGLMGQFMQLLLMMMQLLMTILAGQGKATAKDAGGISGFLNGGNGGGSAAGGAGGGGGAITNLAARGVTADGTARLANKSGGAQGDALDNSMAAIAKDPEGAALLKAAQAKGVTIEVGDPGAASGSADAVACNCANCQTNGPSAAKDANGNVLGVTIHQGNQTKIIVRDPSNIKTIVHELVHAVSTQDGDSKHEEGIADVIGYRVAGRVTGQATQNQQTIYNNKIGVAGYAGLQRYNGIEQTLQQLGISAFA